jgi:class 3 adenylate cyclase
MALLAEYQGAHLRRDPGAWRLHRQVPGRRHPRHLRRRRPSETLRRRRAARDGGGRWGPEAGRTSASLPGLEPLRLGFAAAGRPVVFGAVGDPARLEFTVIGEPVNLAAKLEKHTKVEGAPALTNAETLAIAEGQGYVPARAIERRPMRRIEGVAEPVDLVAYL